jgi:hypothetical protein
MRILKTKKFAKDAESEGLTDAALKAAIEEFKNGLIDATLGGNLYKKRVAVGSKGKSGGLRTILVYKAGDKKLFCVYLFSKDQKDNISKTELKAFKALADFLLGLDEAEIKKSIESTIFIEVK